MTTTDGPNSPTNFCIAKRCASRPRRPGRKHWNCKQAGVDPLLQIDADRCHVANDLGLGLLEGEVQGALPATAGGVAELRGQRRLAGAGGAADEHGAALVEASVTEHRVEPGDAGRHPLGGHAVAQTERRDRQHRDTGRADQERVLVRPVQRAPVLQDPQPPGRRLLGHAVVEHDHAVRDVLLDAMPRERAVATLAGDHRRDAAFLEPAEQAPQLGPQDRRVRERAEQGLDRVDHDPLGADLVDRRADPHEQPVEVPVAGLCHLFADHRDVVDDEHARRPRVA